MLIRHHPNMAAAKVSKSEQSWVSRIAESQKNKMRILMKPLLRTLVSCAVT